jgi:hypothetical protein
MIGSQEYDSLTNGEDIFVPLIDGNLIRFTKEGFLEVIYTIFPYNDFSRKPNIMLNIRTSLVFIKKINV